jgi:hypothetical protein
MRWCNSEFATGPVLPEGPHMIPRHNLIIIISGGPSRRTIMTRFEKKLRCILSYTGAHVRHHRQCASPPAPLLRMFLYYKRENKRDKPTCHACRPRGLSSSGRPTEENHSAVAVCASLAGLASWLSCSTLLSFCWSSTTSTVGGASLASAGSLPC